MDIWPDGSAMSYLVPTHVASLALDVTQDQIQAWAAAGIVTPVDTAPGGTRLWDVEQLREQLRRHLDEGGTLSVASALTTKAPPLWNDGRTTVLPQSACGGLKAGIEP